MAVPVTIPVIEAPIILITHIEIDVSMSMLISTMFGKKIRQSQGIEEEGPRYCLPCSGSSSRCDHILGRQNVLTQYLPRMQSRRHSILTESLAMGVYVNCTEHIDEE